ncbi:DUF2956 domain-containing protein [Thalassotalea sp. PLHSN55]|uniref:DUF2956 domain-containing protein n=1 Tax=Thalassotalea sp. PLHSN55 TaxID=3435888 RepID=UPI003F872A19
MSEKSSVETQNEAMKIAKGTQKKGQSKEQTKLIAQGIEKGISEYKKQQKAKARERDKLRKKELKAKQVQDIDNVEQPKPASNSFINKLPWVLLLLSWLVFIVFTLK